MNCSTTYFGCEKTVKFDTGVDWASLPIIRIHPGVAQESETQWVPHQEKRFPSVRNGCVRVDELCQSRQRHTGGGWLRARRQYHPSRYISPSECRFAVSSRPVGLRFSTNTLALWRTVTICWDGFIGYTVASEWQCNGWRCGTFSSRSFCIKLEERRMKVRGYDTTRPWGSTERASGTKSW